jgi:hypothetical protein
MALTNKRARKKKRRVSKPRRVRSLRRFSFSPAERAWRTWSHDFDTLLHQLVKNPALVRVPPVKIIARAEAFADAYRAMQVRRRPKGVKDGW